MGVSYIIPDIFPNGKRVFVFAACRQRGAFGWTRGPGTRGGSGRDLPAGPFSTPRFLAAQRSAVSSRREEIAVVALAAQHNTRVCGPLCDPSGSSQAMPSLSGASTVLVSTLVLDCNCKSVCSSFNDQAAEQRTYSLSPPQGIFALQKSLRGDCGGDGVPAAVGNSSPRAKKFPEEICFAPRRVFQICRTPD